MANGERITYPSAALLRTHETIYQRNIEKASQGLIPGSSDELRRKIASWTTGLSNIRTILAHRSSDSISSGPQTGIGFVRRRISQ